jgi:hypothetical protein
MSLRIDRRRGLLDDIPTDIAADMDAWADWVKAYRDGPGLGGGSMIWRMMVAKRLGIMSWGTTVEPEMPERLADVDGGVGRLERREQKAFCAYYLQYARSEDKAKTCRCDVRTFHRRVKRARRMVADFVESRRNSR